MQYCQYPWFILDRMKAICNLYIFRYYRMLLIQSSISWDITACSPLKVNQSFGWTCRFLFQGWGIKQVIHQFEAGSTQSPPFVFGLVFDPEYGRDMFSEMSVEFRLISYRYILEDRTLNTHRHENLTSYIWHSCSPFWNYLNPLQPTGYCMHTQTSAANLKIMYFAQSAHIWISHSSLNK
jgi:hypothetical protein